MKRSITQFVKACELCRRNKIVKHTRQPAIITTTPTKPFEIITVDSVGPLPKSNSNNRYAITIQCELSKYIVLAPIPDKEANTIAKSITENFILTYGKFLEVRSDQGTEYINEVVSQICKQLNIKQTFATDYHPETIGALERNHRCLNEYLRSFVNEHQTDWDEWLKFYQFSYNTTPNTSHGYTPHELVFGVKAKLPYEHYEKSIDPLYNFEQYQHELRYRLQRSHQIANKASINTKINTTQQLNQKQNPIKIDINDTVYLKKENRRKLDSFYNGPYQVIEIVEPNCKIKHKISNQSFTVHINRLIK